MRDPLRSWKLRIKLQTGLGSVAVSLKELMKVDQPAESLLKVGIHCWLEMDCVNSKVARTYSQKNHGCIPTAMKDSKAYSINTWQHQAGAITASLYTTGVGEQVDQSQVSVFSRAQLGAAYSP